VLLDPGAGGEGAHEGLVEPAARRLPVNVFERGLMAEVERAPRGSLAPLRCARCGRPGRFVRHTTFAHLRPGAYSGDREQLVRPIVNTGSAGS
jgi:hypothetical protein